MAGDNKGCYQNLPPLKHKDPSYVYERMAVAIPFLREMGYGAIADAIADGCQEILRLRANEPS